MKKLSVLILTVALLATVSWAAVMAAGNPPSEQVEATLAAAATAPHPVIADHTHVDINVLPAAAITAAKNTLHIGYGHTSHGSQIADGMTGLVGFANGGGRGLALPEDIFAWNRGGTGGALDMREGSGYDAGDLDHDVGYYPNWVNETAAYLGDPITATGFITTGRGSNHPEINVIMWSWCGQAAGRTEQTMIDTYLAPMTQFEATYPGVTFVYMTGHSDGTGEEGNLHLRNQQIRDYCLANNKVLFDFYDIELYDPDGAYYGDRRVDDACYYDSNGDGTTDHDNDENWATSWQISHTQNVDWYACGCIHSQALNCNQKAYAIWWLWARLGGWDGVTGNYASSDQSGNWDTPGTWRGDSVPAAGDAVTITTNTSVTVGANAECYKLTIEPGATLIIPEGVTLTVASSVDNQGTIRQVQNVNNGTVAFPRLGHVEGANLYRGVEIDTPNDLGTVTVTLRALNAGEQCTQGDSAHPYAKRCFEIEASHDATATVRLWATAGEAASIGTPRIFRYVKPDWVELSGKASSGSQGGYVYAQGDTPGFSHFLIAESGNNPTQVGTYKLDIQGTRWGMLVAAALALVLGAGAILLRKNNVRG
jgi:hypothetical protein